MRSSKSRPSAAPLVAGLVTALAGAATQQAFAQAADLEEVKVTARRTEESLLDVPLAVTAVSAADLEKYDVSGLKDLSRITPSFFVTEAGGGRQDRNYPNFVFRGMQFFSPTGLTDPSLLFVDGAPVIGGQLATFLNVERVEVLPGPQTAAFGRNTYTGAINIVTRRPGNEWGGSVRASFDDKGSTDVSGSVEGPLVDDRLAFRLAGGVKRFKGSWRNNFDGSTLGDRGTDAASLTLDWKASDSVEVKLFGEWSRYEDGPSDSFDVAGNVHGNCDILGQGRVNYWCGDLPGSLARLAEAQAASTARIDTVFRNLVSQYSIFPGRLLLKGPGLAAVNVKSHAIVDWDLPWQGLQLQTIVAYHNTDLQTVDEATRENLTNQPCVPTATVPCQRSYYLWQNLFERTFLDKSLEMRLTSDPQRALRWALGANYVKVDGQTGNIAQDAPPAFGGARFATNQGRTKIETQGLFGSLYADLGSQFTAGAEIRVQSDKVRSDPFGLTSFLENTFHGTGGRLSLQYKPTERVSVFTNLSNGFRPGTFNNRLLTLPPAAVAQLEALGVKVNVDQEKIEQWELGVRGAFLDGRLQGSLVGYVGRLKDQQISNFTLVTVNGAPTTITYVGNTGKSDFHGVEFDGTARFTDNWSMRLAGSWNVLTIKQAFCGNCTAFGANPNTAAVGKTLPWNPEKKASAALNYDRALGEERSFFGSLEYQYESTKYADELEITGTGARNVVNLRLGVRSGPMTFEFYGLNLGNDLTFNLAQRSNEIPSLYALGMILGLPDKRRFGLRAAYDF